MKLKTSAIILIVASGLVILFNFIDFRMFEYNPLNAIINLFLPISLLILGISLISNKPANYNVATDNQNIASVGDNQIISIGDWLIIFLITIIPLVGLIFIIIWANDDKNKIRKNYAIATLIWWGITILFTIFLFSTVLSSFFRELLS